MGRCSGVGVGVVDIIKYDQPFINRYLSEGVARCLGRKHVTGSSSLEPNQFVFRPTNFLLQYFGKKSCMTLSIDLQEGSAGGSMSSIDCGLV